MARGLDLGEGDEVLLPRHEFPSNDLPWRWLARRGVRVRVVEPDDPTRRGLGGAARRRDRAAHAGRRLRPRLVPARRAHRPGPGGRGGAPGGRGDRRGREPGGGRAPLRLRRVRRRRVRGERLQVPARPVRLRASASSRRRSLDRLAVTDVNWWSVVGAEDFNHLPDGGRAEAGRAALRRARAGELQQPHAARRVAPAAPRGDPRPRPGPRAGARRSAPRARCPPGFEPASPLEPAQRSHILCLRAASPAGDRGRLRAAPGGEGGWSPCAATGSESRRTSTAREADVDRLLAALAGRALTPTAPAGREGIDLPGARLLYGRALRHAESPENPAIPRAEGSGGGVAGPGDRERGTGRREGALEPRGGLPQGVAVHRGLDEPRRRGGALHRARHLARPEARDTTPWLTLARRGRRDDRRLHQLLQDGPRQEK